MSTDELETSLGEVFGSQIRDKVAKTAKRCLDFLLAAVTTQDGAKWSKDSIKEFKSWIDEACLVSTALSDGDKIREGLTLILEIAEIGLHSFQAENASAEIQYTFIRTTRSVRKYSDEEIKQLLSFTASLAETEWKDTDTVLVMEFRRIVMSGSQDLFAAIREELMEKLNGCIVEGYEVPEAVEGITALDAITDEVVDESFGLDKSMALSEKTIKMTSLIRDVKAACSFMGIQDDTELITDMRDFEINNRNGLRFLCLVCTRILGRFHCLLQSQ